ncbi:DsbA family protein [Microbacterium sp.]|uniref:DsbA family protein n=1 Tax=Microbacterium sp. TaxID=51671 RepID=UPI003C24DCC8
MSPLVVSLIAIIGVLVIVIVAFLVTAATQASGAAAPTDESASEGAPPLPDLARRDAADPTALGDVDAPVVIVEWADYRCPFCGVFARETQPTIIAEYVEQGLVRIEWRDLPVFGDESTLAAAAGRAAGEQGLFWEFHDAVFADAPERGHAELPRERLIEIARGIGVPDLVTFETDMDDPTLQGLVQADLEEGYSLGVTSTPIFLIGQTPIAGAQPLEAFRQAIELELDRVGR